MAEQTRGWIGRFVLYALYGLAALIGIAGFLAEVLFIGAWIGLWPLPSEP
jgi:hypothetical protein